MTSAPRALVVDDNQLNSNLVAAFLRKLGWAPEVVHSGHQALDMLRESRFDLVLLDLRMPALGGEEVCRRIRQDLCMADLRVVAYTAHGMPEEKQRMLAAGFSGLLVKPISFADVKAMCDELRA